jgi:hypothetical protein
MFIQQSPLSAQLLTLLKPLGKEIPVRLGEIVEGEVVDLFPGGGLTLKIKGSYLPIRSSLNFKKNEILSLKVLGKGSVRGELVLQLLSGTSRPGMEEASGLDRLGSEPRDEKIPASLLKLINKLEEAIRGHSSSFSNDVKVRGLIEEILKGLPSDIRLLPKEVRNRLQQILEVPIKSLLSAVGNRVIQLLQQLPEGEMQKMGLENFADEILFSIDGLNGRKLKEALESTGLVLEAKIKALLRSVIQEQAVFSGKETKLFNDLKAILLKYKAIIEDGGHQPVEGGAIKKWWEGDPRHRDVTQPIWKGLGAEVENLLKEMETFQLLSKVSDTLYSFLPVQWEALKRGELIFKKKKQPGINLFSCAIQLHLEKIGPISVFLLMKPNEFYVNFKVNHPQMKAMISSQAQELKEGFQREGLNLTHMDFNEKQGTSAGTLDPSPAEETIISIRI